MKVLKLKKDDKDAWTQDAQLAAADAAAAKALYKDDGKPGIKFKVIGVDAANDAEYRKRGWLV